VLICIKKGNENVLKGWHICGAAAGISGHWFICILTGSMAAPNPSDSEKALAE
jgi:hypothetical protein